MPTLSKSDKSQLKTIQQFLTLGNIGAVKRLATSFIRASSSDSVKSKRIAGLAAIGIEIQ